MENRSQLWIILIVITIVILKFIWDKIRGKIPLILRRIICFTAYGGALYVYIFCYDDWFVKMLGLLFVPLATCLLLFGKWKEWPSFRDFKGFLSVRRIVVNERYCHWVLDYVYDMTLI